MVGNMKHPPFLHNKTSPEFQVVYRSHIPHLLDYSHTLGPALALAPAPAPGDVDAVLIQLAVGLVGVFGFLPFDVLELSPS